MYVCMYVYIHACMFFCMHTSCAYACMLCVFACIHTCMREYCSNAYACVRVGRGGGLGSRPKKMYGERLGDGVEYHLMSPTPRRYVPFTMGRRAH